ncbi:MAG: hypothetical protein IIU99_01650 [Treponema sp.]|nr:hypothetical protein [Treponema sp.]
MGIISIIIGIGICAIGVLQEPAYIFQQTAQINIFIIGSLFICTGLILIALKAIEIKLKYLTTYHENENKNEAHIWICETCNTENSGDVCSKCGEKKSKIIV